MALNPDIDKKTTILIAGVAAVFLGALIFIRPVIKQANSVKRDVQVLDYELAQVRAAVDAGKRINRTRHLLSRDEVSLAINELVNVGTKFKVSFLSTNPKPIQKGEGAKYPVLPIHIEVQSAYQDLGKFLGAIEDLEKSVAVVKNFTIIRDQDILPEVRTDLVVEMYMKEGEGG